MHSPGGVVSGPAAEDTGTYPAGKRSRVHTGAGHRLPGPLEAAWYAGVVPGEAEVSAALAAERGATLERLELLDRESAGIVQAAGAGG
jgi:hypothetical protein